MSVGRQMLAMRRMQVTIRDMEKPVMYVSQKQGATYKEHTEKSCVEDKLVAPFVILLENGHVPCCADHEENHEHGGDRDVDILLWCAAERPCYWKVRSTLFLLCDVRTVGVSGSMSTYHL
jgi:hypothetical protein